MGDDGFERVARRNRVVMRQIGVILTLTGAATLLLLSARESWGGATAASITLGGIGLVVGSLIKR